MSRNPHSPQDRPEGRSRASVPRAPSDRGSVPILKWSLAAGALYFLLVAMAHRTAIKIPGLFIYFNLPSFAYQNLIISLLAFGWACFFLLGVLLAGRGIVLPIGLHLIAGVVAVAALVRINLSDELMGLAAGTTRPYWIQTGVLRVYVVRLGRRLDFT